MASATTGPQQRKTRAPRPGPGPILRSALDSFYRQGYGAASVRDIAAGAGVSVAAVYHHFESKQEMLVSLMLGAMQDNLVAVRALYERHEGDERAQLSSMVATIVGYHTSHQAEAFVGNSELRSLEEPGRSQVIALRDEEERLFRDVIERGVENGTFSASNTVLVTRAILAMATGVATWYRPKGRLTVEEIQREYGAIALSMVDAERNADRQP